MRKTTENFIHISEYLQICDKQGVTESKDALILSRYFHDIGVFLHFQDNETLKKWVILRNEWATDAVYRVLDDAEIILQKGHFNPEDLQRIWHAKEYEYMRDALLELMKEFRLCYPKPDGQRYIAPSLLPTVPAKYDWLKQIEPGEPQLLYPRRDVGKGFGKGFYGVGGRFNVSSHARGRYFERGGTKRGPPAQPAKQVCNR